MVSSLIDNDIKWWKVDVIRSIFLPFEANTILKIPLSYNLPKDNLIWLGNKKGIFTVKSAYHIASSMVDSNENAESSSSNARTSLWNLALENSTKTQNICLEDMCQRPSYHV